MNLLMLSLVMLAALGGYSRVYLSQHFVSDVCVGSIIGFVSPCLFFYLAWHKIRNVGQNVIRWKRNRARN
jgi:membrane-associated phospholipid phosphatase